MGPRPWGTARLGGVSANNMPFTRSAVGLRTILSWSRYRSSCLELQGRRHFIFLPRSSSEGLQTIDGHADGTAALRLPASQMSHPVVVHVLALGDGSSRFTPRRPPSRLGLLAGDEDQLCGRRARDFTGSGCRARQVAVAQIGRACLDRRRGPSDLAKDDASSLLGSPPAAAWAGWFCKPLAAGID